MKGFTLSFEKFGDPRVIPYFIFLITLVTLQILASLSVLLPHFSLQSIFQRSLCSVVFLIAQNRGLMTFYSVRWSQAAFPTIQSHHICILLTAAHSSQTRSSLGSLSFHLCFLLTQTHFTFIWIFMGFFLLEKCWTEDISKTKAHTSCWLCAKLQNLQTTLEFMLSLLCFVQMPNFSDHLPMSNVKPKVLSQTGNTIRLLSFISFSSVYLQTAPCV